jgi:predicted GNAT family acetyltransferase
MRLATAATASDFLEAALPFLVAEEARHNLILGLATTIRDTPTLYPEARFWLVLADGGEVVAAALRTPPHNLVLARPATDAALEFLAAHVEDDLPGVTGALPEAPRFAELWRRGRGVGATHRQGIYALETVLPTPPAPGRMRAATAADLPLLAAWWDAFGVEALGEASDPSRLTRALEHRLDPATDAGIVLWDDPDPVSFAGFGGETPNGNRVGPVYTPPELRGRGYATALVSALSSQLLADGCRFCFLYTDLENPTSNRIYQRIGYDRVCDSAQITFE